MSGSLGAGHLAEQRRPGLACLAREAGLEVVMNRINGTIANHVQQTVGNAQSQVSAAEAA